MSDLKVGDIVTINEFLPGREIKGNIERVIPSGSRAGDIYVVKVDGKTFFKSKSEIDIVA